MFARVDNDDDQAQFFVVVDRKIFLDLKRTSYLKAFLSLIAVYFCFNISYKRSQRMTFQFIEEYLLGITPLKKPESTGTAC